MIPEKIATLLTEKGWKPIGVNVNGIYLYYVTLENAVYGVMIFDCPQGTEFTSGQYRNIERQVYQNFVNKNYESTRTLTLICTADIAHAKSIYGNEPNQWYIDTNRAQLILYENQISDFMGLRRDIETILGNEAPDKEYEYVHNPYENSHYYENMNQNENAHYNNDMNQNENTYYNDNGRFQQSAYPRTGRPSGKYFSKYNTILILLNIIVFVFTDLLGNLQGARGLLDAGALYWPAVQYYHQFYRLITYMFLHSGFEHLANNMLVLFVIGDNLERAVGKWKFLVIYFAAGIIAGISSMSYNMLIQVNAVSVGASGAIFGVVGAMIYIVAVNKGRLENISTRQMAVFVLFSLYGGLTSQGVDNAAHIGGLLGGVLLAALLYRKPRMNQEERG